MKKLLRYVLMPVAVGYFALCSYMFIIQRDLIYHGTDERPVLVQAGLQGFSETTVPTADGLDLLAWEAPAAEGKPTILFLHGNAGTLADKAEKVRQLNEAGYGILLLSWRGFSGNKGDPTEDGLYADARAGLDYLYVRGKTNHDVVAYGESLGSGVAAHLAYTEAQAGRPLKALVLYTPYTTLSAAGEVQYWYLPVKWLTLDKYDTLSIIDKVKTPVLVLHGTDDETIPLQQGKDVYTAAAWPKRLQIFQGGRHNDLYDFGAAAAIDAFLADR
ncbi:MAG: alpha/beta hydrolase [Bdellovibrionales bacterium]